MEFTSIVISDGEARPGADLETAVGHPKEQIPTKPIMSMSCTLCTFAITCLTKELAREILYNHQRKRHPRDPNNNLEEGTHDTSNKMIKKMMPIDHKEDPADDDLKNVPDTNSTGDSEDGTCVGIRCGKGWVRD